MISRSIIGFDRKCAEIKKLLLSQDMNVQTCSFCHEQAFLSSLPLVSLEKHLFERSKRNVLTLGAASCYPFTSYEMCDDNGILLGVNKHNNSLIIVDIFDSRTYARLGITHENSTLDDPTDPSRYRTMPVLGDLYEVLKESQETRRLANIINRLVHGSARTFNQQTKE